MTKLCPRGKAAAQRKFKVYPSAYANAYASKICAGKIKDPSGVKRKDFRGRKPASMGGPMDDKRDVRKVEQMIGKSRSSKREKGRKKDGSFAKCGRSKQKADAKRKYPKCVPLAKATRMTKGQKASAVKRKRAAGNPGGKPTNVATFVKKKTA